MSTEFIVTVKATSITVFPGKEASYYLEPLMELMMYEDEFECETKILGFLYEDETDILYMHKGIDVESLRRWLPNMKVRNEPFDKFKKLKFEYEEIIPPRNDEQVDVINFIAGLNHHAGNIEDSQLFLIKKPGFGKGTCYSTPIPTPTRNGFTKMGDLKVGDYVFGHDGKPTQITDIFELGEQDVYKLTFEDGRTSLCTKEHLWKVKRNNGDWEIKLTEELIDSKDKFGIPLCKPVQYKERPTFLHEFGKHHWIIDSCHMTYVNSSPDKMREFLDTHGFRNDSGYVTSPKWIYNEEDKCFWTTNVCLPILYAMGYSAYYNTIDDCIYYSKPKSLKITSIELDHKEKCRCIKVDNPEQLYLTENFIVTHNTFCSGVGLCKYGMKTLIIVHRDTLKDQWMKSLYKMSGLSEEYVHDIKTTEEVVKIGRGDLELDYDVYIMTHATFRAATKYFTSIKEKGNISKNLGIGLKIIDEAHLEFKDTLMMDFCFNVKRNLYLTATGGRSQKDENSIFRHVFSNAEYYSPSGLLTTGTPKKWVEYISVCVNTHLNKNVYSFRVVGSRGMNPASYGKWVIQYDKKKTHFKCCRDLLKQIYENDDKAKVLVFMPLIELCGDAAYFFNKELNYDESFQYDLNIKTINSSNSPHENLMNRRADVIVTTIQSCGTGTDIPGITDIISCSPFVSKITAEQVFGRIRYCGKVCHYYDIFDASVEMDRFWIRSRRKKFKELALNVKSLAWTDDDK